MSNGVVHQIQQRLADPNNNTVTWCGIRGWEDFRTDAIEASEAEKPVPCPECIRAMAEAGRLGER